MAPQSTAENSVQDLGLNRAAIVASGVDTLYLSGRGMLSGSVWNELVERKAEAQDADAPVPYALSGEPVAVCAVGLNRYPIRLNHRYGFVGVTSSSALPTVRFQPLGEFLHGIGVRNMVEWFEAWMREIVVGLKLTVARVDLFADTTGWVLTASDRHRFLSRASLRDTHEDGDDWTGFEFGRHKGGNVMARVYDKTRNIEQRRTLWWRDIWGRSVKDGDTVRRVEIEFGRSALRTFNVDTPDDVFRSLGDLWKYGTEKWLTFRSPTADATKARWPITPEWTLVQSAGLSLPALGVTRTYEARDAAEYEALLPGLTGYASSVAARKGATDLDSLLRAVRLALLEYEKKTDVRVADRIASKRWEASTS